MQKRFSPGRASDRARHPTRTPSRQASPPVATAPAPTPEELAACARQAGLDIPDRALPPLAAYLDRLLRWNSVMNLVGARDWREALSNLVGDSFHLAAFLDGLPLPAEPLCWDLGSGAGLPGIPLRMIWQRGDYWLVEAREKRALFLSQTLHSLRLPRTHVYRGRAEAFFAGQARGADGVISRAFMPPRPLLDLLAPRLAPGGLVVLLLNEADDDPPPVWELVAEQTYAVRRLSGDRRATAAPAGERRRFRAVRLREAGPCSAPSPARPCREEIS